MIETLFSYVFRICALTLPNVETMYEEYGSGSAFQISLSSFLSLILCFLLL